MDYVDIRAMIKECLQQKIAEAKNRANKVPENFSDFRYSLVLSLRRSKAPDHLIEQIEENHHDSDFYDAVHETWENLRVETMDAVTDSEKVAAWNECIDFYLRDLLEERCCNLTESVVKLMKRRSI